MPDTAFELTADQHDYRAWVREVAQDQLVPLVLEAPPGQVNRPLVKELGSLGLLAKLFPGAAEGGGGRQAAAFDLCLLREALATVSTEAETALALQGLGTYPIVQAGTREQVERWVPAVAGGDAVAAFALSESGAGSDAGALGLAGRE